MYLDTHPCVWLYEGKLKKFSNHALKRMDAGDLLISPMVLLELQFLYEIDRLRYPARDVLLKLEAEIALRTCALPFPAVMENALFENWTRDPFDRVIVAHAKTAGLADLLTFDSEIQAHYPRTLH